MSVLVIVPIYKGLDETRDCIDSLIYSLPENTTSTHICLINDCSPEPELVDYLNTLNHPQIDVLHNEENLGFVGTVNRGMESREGADVILLNSDTEVANDWIDRLKAGAYLEDKIGTVTPFSNNATICSFPRMGDDNTLLFNSHIEEIDAVFSTLPATTYEIPTAVGFCMYIKDETLCDVGLFDIEAFGKGYGEENDFCQKAIQKNWTNILLGNVFVYHKGQTSFQDTRNERVANAIKIINERYPHYNQDVATFVENDPAKNHRLQALFELIRQDNRPKILNIYQGTGGGVLRHINELTDFYQNDAIMLTLYSPPEGDEHFVNVELIPGFAYCFNLLEERTDFIQLLKALTISHIHYHHLMRVSEDIWNLADELSCQFDITLHDFYVINGNPTQSHQGIFVGELPKTERDAKCLIDYPLPEGLSVNAWQAKMETFLAKARYIFTPSADTASWLRKEYPTLAFTPTNPPEAFELLNAPTPLRRASSEKPLHVVILGAISTEKGMNVVRAVADKAHADQSNIRFTIMGYTHRQIKNVEVTGSYQEEDADELLRSLNPDLIWLPSIWPETYSYTLSYAISHGLPILSFNIGAFKERLQYRSESYLLPLSATTEEILHWLQNYAKESPERGDITHLPMASVDFYHHNYLKQLTPKTLSSKEAIEWDLFYDYFAKDDESSFKIQLLKGLLKVKRMPWVTPIVDVIPISVQKRIKRALSRRPLNEL